MRLQLLLTSCFISICSLCLANSCMILDSSGMLVALLRATIDLVIFFIESVSACVEAMDWMEEIGRTQGQERIMSNNRVDGWHATSCGQLRSDLPTEIESAHEPAC